MEKAYNTYQTYRNDYLAKRDYLEYMSRMQWSEWYGETEWQQHALPNSPVDTEVTITNQGGNINSHMDE